MSDDRGARDLERRLSEFILSSMGATIESMVAERVREAMKDLAPPPGTATEGYVSQQVGNLKSSLTFTMNQSQMEQDSHLRGHESRLNHHTAQLKTYADNLHELAETVRELGGNVTLVKSPEPLQEPEGDPPTTKPGFINLKLPEWDRWIWIALIVLSVALLVVAGFLIKDASDANAKRNAQTRAAPASAPADPAPETGQSAVTLGAGKVRALLAEGTLAQICPEGKPCQLGEDYEAMSDVSKIVVLQEVAITLDDVGQCPGTPRKDGKIKTVDEELSYQSECLKKLGAPTRTKPLEQADVKQLTLDLLTVLGQQ